MESEPIVQGSLFEDDYLLRSLGRLAYNPEMALTELVANAWDAGATMVDIRIPTERGGKLSISDDGIGMTADQFRTRWMTLRYDRIKRQGRMAEFPQERRQLTRRAYGRNGVGRHGLLCFADEYCVETCRDGEERGRRFVVRATSGETPFVLVSEIESEGNWHGTRLSALVERRLPEVDDIRESLSFRFLHDPSFEISVNGESATLSEHKGLIEKAKLRIDTQATAELFCIRMPTSSRRKYRHGIAFWVGPRLVGEPNWHPRGHLLLDGRSAIAQQLTIVVKSDDLFDEVNEDWTAFKDTPRVDALHQVVEEHVCQLVRRLMSGKVSDSKRRAYTKHRQEIQDLRPLARLELSEFVDSLAADEPLVSEDLLSAAVKAAINLEKSRSGKALLEKLAALSEDDVEGLNTLLETWTIRDALTVLEEIDRRISVIKAIEKLMDDPDADELHTIHPLVTHARWLFGPEFESPLYASNITLRKAAEIVFKKRIDQRALDNPRRRPDLIFLQDATVSITGTEQWSDDDSLTKLTNVLLIELKRGRSSICREAIHQAHDYVEDLLNCGLLDGPPFVRAYVVGFSVARGLHPVAVGSAPESAKIGACSFGQLTRTANVRLFKLQEHISERYKDVSGFELVERVLAEPTQQSLFEV